MTIHKNIILFVITLGIFVSVAYAQIRQVGPAEFQEKKQEQSLQFILNGAGLKKFLTIKVVSVGLYLQDEDKTKDVLSDIPKSIEIVYLQKIPKGELIRATTKGIKKNVSKAEYKQLESKINKCISYYTDVKPQDRITVTYLPGEGTTVFVNDQKKGTIIGKDFARAFYAVWVGKKPVDKKMKLILLGQSKETVT